MKSVYVDYDGEVWKRDEALGSHWHPYLDEIHSTSLVLKSDALAARGTGIPGGWMMWIVCVGHLEAKL